MSLKKRNIFFVAAIVLAGFAVYSNTLENTAFLANPDSILENPLIQNHRNIPLLFSGAVLRYNDSQYRPLNLAMLSVIKAFVKNDNVSFWRLLEAGLHAANAALLFIVIFMCTGHGLFSFLGALIFTVNPQASAFVNNIENIHYMLGMFFLLNTLIFALLFMKNGRAACLAACLTLFLGGLLSSDIVLYSILLVVLLSLFSGEHRLSGRMFMVLVLLVLAGLAYYYVTSKIKLMPLAIFRGQNQALVKRLESFKENVFCPYLLLGACSFAVSLLYLAYGRVKSRAKYILPAIILAAAGYFAPKAYSLNLRYQDNISYWGSALESGGKNLPSAGFNLAKSFYESGMKKQAENIFRVMANTDKGPSDVRIMALYYLTKGCLDEKEFERAYFYLIKMSALTDREIRQIDNELRYIPKEMSYDDEKRSVLFSENELYTKLTLFGHARLYFALGLYDWADYIFSELYLYNPYDLECLYSLGQLMTRKGFYQSAKRYFIRILELDPGNDPARAGIEYVEGVICGSIKPEPAGHYPAEERVSRQFAKMLGKLSMGTLSEKEKGEVVRLLYSAIKER